MAREKKKLSQRQEAFVRAYIQTNDPTEAVRIAGYKTKNKPSMWVQSCRLLKNVKVQERIREIMDEVTQEFMGRAEDVLKNLEYLSKNAKRDADKIRANELLGKYFKLWKDSQEITIKEPIFKEGITPVEILQRRLAPDYDRSTDETRGIGLDN